MQGTLVQKEEVAKGTSFFKFSLDEDIDFKSGQIFHVLLKENVKHHLTIVNSPNEKRVVSMATRMRDSEFKNTLKAMQIGTTVEVYKIKGEFVLPEDTTRPIVFIALGIGITPYISMLRWIREEYLPFHITLIYSDSDRASMPFLTELRAYAKDNPEFKLILTVTHDPKWTGEKRHVDDNFIKTYLPDPASHLYYVSGPPAVVSAVAGSLAKIVPAQQIKSDSFTGY
jgi:ferredoxin-NADP reductase